MQRTPLFIAVPLIVVGVLTVYGGRSYFQPEALGGLYDLGAATLDPVATMLLAHRAAMVAVIGALLFLAAWRVTFLVWLVPLVALSKALFVLAALPVRDAVALTFWFDLVSVVVLAVCWFGAFLRRRRAVAG